MKSSLEWMQDYVEIDRSRTPQEFADVLTVSGIPVERVEYWGRDIQNIITGRMTKIMPHPNADKLVICTLDMGTEALTVVTGATNVREGQVVPVAVHGAVLPGGVKIKKSRLRGELSEGMLCSAHELGLDDSLLLPEERTGIWILPEDTPLGADAVEQTGLRDIVYEYELTPNRADCFSMVGLSREFAVLSGRKAHVPKTRVAEGREKIDGKLKVSVAAPELCARYAARLLYHVKVGKSPFWMQQRLRKAGVRPINNIVDVTNYTMLEFGIPLHAYDYDKLAEHELIVRRAGKGEKITTLDNVTRELTEDMLVIADAEKAACVAGIMGGLDSEVTENTTTVVLECASFKGSGIRKTGRALGLRSEASARFERGLDSEGCVHSLDRAAQLLQETGACEVAAGVVDEYVRPQEVRRIPFTAEQVNAFLGTDISEKEMIAVLETLGFTTQVQGESVTATVPTWRVDCAEMPDIAEEVARIYGYERIKSTRPLSNISEGQEGFEHAVREHISSVLSRSGLNETVTFSFMNNESLQKLLFEEGDAHYTAVPILNPITEEFPLMRTTLLPSLMEVLVRNQAVKNDAVGIYEIAATYRPKALPITELPAEETEVAGLIYGKRHRANWPYTAEDYDFYDVKGLVEVVLDSLGIEAGLQISDYAPLHPGKAAEYVKDGKVLCRFGELHPEAVDNYDVAGPVYIFEMYLKNILPLVNLIPDYHKVGKFPALTRDLAVLVPISTRHEDILAVIRKKGGKNLEGVHLFDMYAGEQVPRGYVSLAFALTFRSAEGTLSDEDIQEPIQGILDELQEKLGAKLR